MDFTIFMTVTAKNDLAKIPIKEARKVVEKIDFFIRSGNPLKFAKSLGGILQGKYRFRVGVYRIIFYLDNRGVVQILTILNIRHRKDVYKL